VRVDLAVHQPEQNTSDDPDDGLLDPVRQLLNAVFRSAQPGSTVRVTWSPATAGTGLCLAAQGKKSGARAIEVRCAGNADQYWRPTNISGTTCNLRNSNSGMCLASRGSAGAVQIACNPQDYSQRWKANRYRGDASGRAGGYYVRNLGYPAGFGDYLGGGDLVESRGRST
jgi:hypothetical protein